MKHVLLFVAIGISVLLPGCADKPKLGQVTGTVTYKGEPVKEGTITFIPADGRSATGKIVDGKIVDVTCFEPNDGVPLGPQTVLIQGPGSDDMYKTAKSPIPERYGTLQSGLKADIVAGENPPLNFELK